MIPWRTDRGCSSLNKMALHAGSLPFGLPRAKSAAKTKENASFALMRRYNIKTPVATWTFGPCETGSQGDGIRQPGHQTDLESKALESARALCQIHL